MTEENKQEVEETEEVEQEEEKQEEKTFTQDEVNKIIEQRLAREKRDKEKAIKEAEKLAKMNADEKQQYEFEKTQRELEEARKQLNFYELSKTATEILAESGITANEDILKLVVGEDAEQTQESVTAFKGLISELVDAQVKEKLRGQAPRKTQQPQAITKEDVLQMGYNEQLEFKRKNEELYNKLFRGD